MSANADLARLFDDMASALELLGANPFRANAHARVARALRDMTDDAVEGLLPLTHLTHHIMLTVRLGPMHGYAISKAVAELSRGRVAPGTGTFYSALRRMMDEGGGQMEASLVKLLACKLSEWITREAMQLYPAEKLNLGLSAGAVAASAARNSTFAARGLRCAQSSR